MQGRMQGAASKIKRTRQPLLNPSKLFSPAASPDFVLLGLFLFCFFFSGIRQPRVSDVKGRGSSDLRARRLLLDAARSGDSWTTIEIARPQDFLLQFQHNTPHHVETLSESQKIDQCTSCASVDRASTGEHRLGLRENPANQPGPKSLAALMASAVGQYP